MNNSSNTISINAATLSDVVRFVDGSENGSTVTFDTVPFVTQLKKQFNNELSEVVIDGNIVTVAFNDGTSLQFDSRLTALAAIANSGALRHDVTLLSRGVVNAYRAIRLYVDTLAVAPVKAGGVAVQAVGALSTLAGVIRHAATAAAKLINDQANLLLSDEEQLQAVLSSIKPNKPLKLLGTEIAADALLPVLNAVETEKLQDSIKAILAQIASFDVSVKHTLFSSRKTIAFRIDGYENGLAIADDVIAKLQALQLPGTFVANTSEALLDADMIVINYNYSV